MKEEHIKTAYLIRAFENEIQKQFTAGIIKGTVHLSIGQELADVEVIRSYDNPLVFGNHRSHGQYIAATDDIKGCYKQILQNRTQHLYYPDKFLSTGIQGGLCPVAAGNALAYKLRGIDRRVLCFIGDGTLGQGVFWESLNFSAIKKLPITFVIIDNGYSMSHTETAINIDKIKELYRLTEEGCQVIHHRVTRLCGHSCNDTQAYRPKDEQRIDLLTDNDYAKEAEQTISALIGR